jgi:hypothetical protein
MPFVIDLSRDIAAPAAVVWKVITDLDAYGEWNPFVVRCRSTLEPGQPIQMWVRLLPFVQYQAETVFEHVPLDHLCYGVAPARWNPMRSRRCHEIREAGAATTRYRSYFELSGAGEPIVRLLLGARLQKGFRAMTDALQKRAELMAA